MTIKVVSLNMWWGGKLFPAILEFLRDQDADIVLLQEVHDGHSSKLIGRQRSMDVLKEHLNYLYQGFAQAFIVRTSEGKLPVGNAILSKFPIKDRSSKFIFEPTKDFYVDVPEEWPMMPRILQHARLETPSGEVNVFNLHGIWDIEGDIATPDRRKMVDIILEQTAGKPNVIVAGDTNAKASNPVWQPLEKMLLSVFGQELKSTFNMSQKSNGGYATAAVDLMYVSPNMQVLSRECPDVDVSDHLPIVAVIDILNIVE